MSIPFAEGDRRGLVVKKPAEAIPYGDTVAKNSAEQNAKMMPNPKKLSRLGLFCPESARSPQQPGELRHGFFAGGGFAEFQSDRSVLAPRMLWGKKISPELRRMAENPGKTHGSPACAGFFPRAQALSTTPPREAKISGSIPDENRKR
jgi:hypothetical protein